MAALPNRLDDDLGDKLLVVCLGVGKRAEKAMQRSSLRKLNSLKFSKIIQKAWKKISIKKKPLPGTAGDYNNLIILSKFN